MPEIQSWQQVGECTGAFSILKGKIMPAGVNGVQNLCLTETRTSTEQKLKLSTRYVVFAVYAAPE